MTPTPTCRGARRALVVLGAVLGAVLGVVLGTTLLAALVVPVTAAAATVPAAVPAVAPDDDRGPAFVRLAHLSPDTPTVDVYLTPVASPQDQVVVPGVGYGTVSQYRSLPRGAYTVGMRAAGAPTDSPPVISTTLRTDPGAAYTVAGVGHYRDLGLTVLDDDLAMPDPGQARVRVINAAATAPRVDVLADGVGELATDVGFADDTGYRGLPAGDRTLRVRATGGVEVPLPVGIAGNTVYTVLLLDGPGGLRTELHTDSSGSGGVPVGGVETGRADPTGPPRAAALLSGSTGLLAAGAVAAAVVARRRDVARGRP